jgi:predicted DNA-binding protein
MPRKPKTETKSFRFPPKICRWLERKKKESGRTHTWILLDALAAKYPEVQNLKP